MNKGTFLLASALVVLCLAMTTNRGVDAAAPGARPSSECYSVYYRACALWTYKTERYCARKGWKFKIGLPLRPGGWLFQRRCKKWKNRRARDKCIQYKTVKSPRCP